MTSTDVLVLILAVVYLAITVVVFYIGMHHYRSGESDYETRRIAARLITLAIIWPLPFVLFLLRTLTEIMIGVIAFTHDVTVTAWGRRS